LTANRCTPSLSIACWTLHPGHPRKLWSWHQAHAAREPHPRLSQLSRIRYWRPPRRCRRELRHVRLLRVRRHVSVRLSRHPHSGSPPIHRGADQNEHQGVNSSHRSAILWNGRWRDIYVLYEQAQRRRALLMTSSSSTYRN
ncbi:hypothetical protein PENTCL1PPCAC_21685, partial [Pristionchus entomophagus]